MAVAISAWRSLCRFPVPRVNSSPRRPSSPCRAAFSDPEDDGGGGKKKEKGSKPMAEIFSTVAKMRENLSPKQKGDWKDVLLMSLSFAVYVYISQQLVWAYCAWKSLL